MTQEDKELLLKYLSEHIPYNVFVHTDFGDYEVIKIVGDRVFTKCEEEGKHNDFPVEIVKPYLRSRLSMTKKERQEYLNTWNRKWKLPTWKTYYWLNAHHFDYKCLIEKDLAMMVTKENNPYK